MPVASQSGLRRVANFWWSRCWQARALLPLAWIFAGLVAIRRTLYRIGWLRTAKLPVPVVVVGNVIAGGAGKTPAVIAIAQMLRMHGLRPAVISRGYGRRHDDIHEVMPDDSPEQTGDEPLLLRIRLGLPVVVGRDRVKAARALLAAHPEVDVLVSDDGLQHWRLPRAAQVIVFDERGAGNGWMLPAGPLRERLPAAVPARTLVLYNAMRPSTALDGTSARSSVTTAVPLADWWARARSSGVGLQRFAHQPIVAAAGTANPRRFFDMLGAQGLDIVPLPLPDHFDFSTQPWPAGTCDVLITEKDAVKLSPQRDHGTRIWVAPLDFQLDERFERALLALLPPSPAQRTRHGHPIA